jgi:hypothetical protein
MSQLRKLLASLLPAAMLSAALALMGLPGPGGFSGRGAAQANSEAAAQPLLPDLQALPPSALYIVPGNGGEKRLKFATVIWNAGPGVLEVQGSEDPATGTCTWVASPATSSG